ncbi:MAG: archease [Haloferacaceae archaeon]
MAGGRFDLRAHTADVAVEATGPDLSAAFAAAADGLAAASCDDVPPGGERFAVSVTAESREALLFDYLDRLIYERDVRGVLPVDNEATVEAAGGAGDRDGEGADGGWTVSASARGVPLDRIAARDVKAVTYSEMAVEPTDDGWRAYVVLDV